ncbi:MAG TPA: ABC transporter substrate-binding protein [Actinomycetota bacterium]|nr:ABC transporter substrate-binding protein [Actinomycetota bacterium]
MDETRHRLDSIRKRSSELDNHLIDELQAGRLSRRDFIRRGTVMGMSLPLLSFIAAACGGGGEVPGASSGGSNSGAKAKPGGDLRTGIGVQAGALDPVTINFEAGLTVLGQSGEYLSWSDKDLQLQPRVAESWEPNEDASVWTFKIRKGVKFNDGTPLSAEDVAATINLHADPKNGSNALSVFGPVLKAGAASATDDETVKVELEAPNGNFPYLVSSDNYNLIILPKTYDGNWEKTFIGAGPWKMDQYDPEVSVKFVKNPDYWDTSRAPIADTSEIKFYEEEQAKILGLQGGEVDVINNFSVVGGKALLTDPTLIVLQVESSAHRQVHMRTDKPPFDDKRVRQAMALLMNRNELVEGLWEGKASLGNDSPFAPVFPSTDTSIQQREEDIEQAKQLIADAGAEGTSVEIRGWNGFEMPDLAAVIKNQAAEGGITVQLNITNAATYYGDAVFGKSPWLDSSFGITEYGHRGVPNVLLDAPLTSNGVWNSAHFKNKTYDKLVADYVAALDLQGQKQISGKIQELLLDEVPIMFLYFYYHLGATKQNVTGVEKTGMGHIDLTAAGFTQ